MESMHYPPNMAIGISPCPNDTSAFCAWIHNSIVKTCNIQPIFADIETLNGLALAKEIPFCKVSAALLSNLKNYRLLPCGAAVGNGCGPKIIAKKGFDICELKNKRVVFPGRFTSAYALFRKLLKCKEEQFSRFDQLISHVRQNRADAAVIIHETRFIFEKMGFCEICDLGKIWQKKMRLPIPLGILVARNDVSAQQEANFIDHFRRSLAYEVENPGLSDHYSALWASESSAGMRRQHIDLYVNDETRSLSPEGHRAIEVLNSVN